VTSARKWGDAALGQSHNVDLPPSYVAWEYTAARPGSVRQQGGADSCSKPTIWSNSSHFGRCCPILHPPKRA